MKQENKADLCATVYAIICLHTAEREMCSGNKGLVDGNVPQPIDKLHFVCSDGIAVRTQPNSNTNDDVKMNGSASKIIAFLQFYLSFSSMRLPQWNDSTIRKFRRRTLQKVFVRSFCIQSSSITTQSSPAPVLSPNTFHFHRFLYYCLHSSFSALLIYSNLNKNASERESGMHFV